VFLLVKFIRNRIHEILSNVLAFSIHSFIDALTSNNFEGRGFVYTEKYNTQSQGVDYTIRNSTHKYIYFNSGNEALYNLSANPFESPNLLNSNQLPLSTSDSSEKASLMNELSIIRQD